jgi:mannose-1-phosphate guanylyltransferase
VQALVLAGGEGTRLRPLTTTVPKPVLPLANRPFVSYMIDWLARHGFDEVVISCGFLSEAVRAVLGAGGGEIRIRYIEEPEPLGTAGAVKFAEPVLEERFAVLNGDILADFDLGALCESHERRNAHATIALIEIEDPSAYGLVLRDSDGRVTEFLEKPDAAIPGQRPLINAGAYVLERKVLEALPEGRPVSFEREVFPALVGDGLFGCEVAGYWLDIGTPERYLQATRDILMGTIDTVLAGTGGGFPIGHGTSVDTRAHLHDPVLVGVGCEIAAGAEVGPMVVLGDGCEIGAGAHVADAVLHERARVEDDAVVRGSIVGAGASIGAGSRIEESTVVGAGAQIPRGARLAGARVDPPRAGRAAQS